jgi:hypothetical protein
MTRHAAVGGNGVTLGGRLIDDALEGFEVFDAVPALTTRGTDGLEASLVVPCAKRRRTTAENLSRDLQAY